MIPELPFEILLELAEYFDPWAWHRAGLEDCELDDGKPDFEAWHREVLSLSLVSKRWYTAFGPLLALIWIRGYRTVKDYRHHLERQLHGSKSSPQCHTISIPELWAYRMEDVQPIVAVNQRARQAAERISREAIWLKGFNNKADPTTSRAFMTREVSFGLREECVEAEIALLLSLLPSLRNIHIRLESEKGIVEQQSMLHLFARARQDATLLPSLRRIVLSWTPHRGFKHGYRPIGIEHILALPNLRELDASGFWSDCGDYGFFTNLRTRAEIPLNSSRVQHLKLRSWDGNLGLLRQITGACKRLRSFELHFDEAGDPLTFEAGDVLTALHKHKDSLQRLILLSVPGCILTHDEYWVLPVGPLKRFPALKHLDLPISLLVGKPAHALKQNGILQPGVTLEDRFGNDMEDYLRSLTSFLAKSYADFLPYHSSLWSLLTDVFPASLEMLNLRENRQESGLATLWWENFFEHAEHRLPNEKETWRWHADDEEDDPDAQGLQDARGIKLVERLGLSRTIAEAYPSLTLPIGELR